MPKLIEYPRTNYAGAWELSDVVDDTGGKSSVEAAARKLNRKISGSFKAIIGSAVKFGLLTSKRELLSTTTLFKRIKHAYDKQEELVFHREAFLTPPLFTQLCRKFRGRELPVQMLDVMLMREFGVEEINALGVARAFVEGARMVGLLDEHNTVADIDLLTTQQPPRRELGNPMPVFNNFRPNASLVGAHRTNGALNQEHEPTGTQPDSPEVDQDIAATPSPVSVNNLPHTDAPDAIANLFGLATATEGAALNAAPVAKAAVPNPSKAGPPFIPRPERPAPGPTRQPLVYNIQISGQGIDTTLTITDEEDLNLVQALLDKIRRQLANNQ